MGTIIERQSAGRASPAAQPTNDDGEDFLRILWRRRTLLLASILLGLTAALLIIEVVPARYSARAVMRVDTDDIDSASAQATLSSTRELELRRDHQIETQLQLLSSRPLMRQVVRQLALWDDPEFNPNGDIYGKAAAGRLTKTSAVKRPPTPSPLLIEGVTDRLMRTVRVAQDGQTSFLNIDVSSTSAGKAARIANKIASTYVQSQVDEEKASNQRAIQALSRQVSDLRNQLIALERGAATYKRAHRLDGTPSDDNRAGEIGQLAGALAVARSARAEAEARASSRSGSGASLSSPLLTDLRDEETQARRHLAELTTMYGRGHPEVRKAEAQLSEIGRSMAAESERARQQLLSETAALRARETQLAREVEAARSRSLNDVITGVPLADMERNGDATRAVYVSLLGRLDGLMRENELVRPDATLAFQALPPTSPSAPKVSRILVVAVAASGLFGLILVLIVEQLDTKVRTPGQVERLTGLRTFGMLPQVLPRNRDRLTHAERIDQPYSAFTEEVRSICTKVSRLLPSGRGGIILVSSAEPGDGKTTVSLAMGAAAVATKRSAIVVDLDLRRPEVAPGGGAALEAGDLIDYLTGAVPLEQAIRSYPGMPALQLMSAVRPASDPGALVASQRLPALLEQLRARFDLVILNTPPVLAVHDAAAVSPLADVILLVVGWGRTSRHKLIAAVGQVEHASGVVFNHVPVRAHTRTSYEQYIHDHGSGGPSGHGAWRRPLRHALSWRHIGRSLEA